MLAKYSWPQPIMNNLKTNSIWKHIVWNINDCYYKNIHHFNDWTLESKPQEQYILRNFPLTFHFSRRPAENTCLRGSRWINTVDLFTNNLSIWKKKYRRISQFTARKSLNVNEICISSATKTGFSTSPFTCKIYWTVFRLNES